MATSVPGAAAAVALAAAAAASVLELDLVPLYPAAPFAVAAHLVAADVAHGLGHLDRDRGGWVDQPPVAARIVAPVDSAVGASIAAAAVRAQLLLAPMAAAVVPLQAAAAAAVAFVLVPEQYCRQPAAVSEQPAAAAVAAAAAAALEVAAVADIAPETAAALGQRRHVWVQQQHWQPAAGYRPQAHYLLPGPSDASVRDVQRRSKPRTNRPHPVNLNGAGTDPGDNSCDSKHPMDSCVAIIGGFSFN